MSDDRGSAKCIFDNGDFVCGEARDSDAHGDGGTHEYEEAKPDSNLRAEQFFYDAELCANFGAAGDFAEFGRLVCSHRTTIARALRVLHMVESVANASPEFDRMFGAQSSAECNRILAADARVFGTSKAR